ncbi:DUF397 domain-containing protein [Actinoalloteichus sp. AHMU CJ021]|uniref:DUF397 domain-containing protein n=1 Tax=Actinoalloteichus sp. AHMU CJ021 TaxID=2072503 RepID=UPI000CA04CCD|nr:DUF397 domain-containing protein [Actinoalloteichus sp. AHMU CJ021]
MSSIPTPAMSWRTSSRTNANGGTCVEIGRAANVVGIRDTKNRDGGTLHLDTTTFTTFLDALKQGRY